MGILEIGGLIVLALVAGIAAKMFLDIQQKEYTDDRMRQTFAAQSKGMEDDSASSDFAEYQESVLEHIDGRINDGFPVLGEKIVHAGYRIKAFQWCGMIFLITLVVAVLPIFFLQSTFGIWAIVFSVVLFILVPAIAYFILNMHIGQRVSIFDEQFGVGLDVMSASMKAGGTFMSSIRFVAEGSEAPLSNEMGLLSTELGLGTDMNTALDRFRQRFINICNCY
jgi:Flp pilus assembly protein TadB